MKGKQAISISWKAILAVAFVAFIRKLRTPAEPVACGVIRDTLEASFKVNNWMAQRAINLNATFPIIPLSLIDKCGDASFKMPHPFKFVFDENPISGEEVVGAFLARNKTVYTRPVPPLEVLERLTEFSDVYQGKFLSEKMSFQDAWPQIHDGTRRMYFDNTWESVDYKSIMSESAYDSLMAKSAFFAGSMFMSCNKKFLLTAPAHSAPVKSVATQVTNRKDWVFLDPKVVKKYLTSELNHVITKTVLISQNDAEVLKHVPHYTVSTNAGEGVYFPEYWFHIVYTEPGVNIMTNWRQQQEVMAAWNSPSPFMDKVKMSVAAFLFQNVIPTQLADKIKAVSQDLFHKGQHENAWMIQAIAAAKK